MHKHLYMLRIQHIYYDRLQDRENPHRQEASEWLISDKYFYKQNTRSSPFFIVQNHISALIQKEFFGLANVHHL